MIPSLPPVDRMADSGWRNRRAIVGQMAARRVVPPGFLVGALAEDDSDVQACQQEGGWWEESQRAGAQDAGQVHSCSQLWGRHSLKDSVLWTWFSHSAELTEYCDRNPIIWVGFEHQVTDFFSLGNKVLPTQDAITPPSKKHRSPDMSVPETLVWGLAGEELVGEDYVWQTACASLQEVLPLQKLCQWKERNV